MTELRDVLAAAQQAGKEKQAAQGTLKERAAAGLRAKAEAARQSAAEAWKNAKPVPERVYQTVDALVQGAAAPEIRQAMGAYVQERNDAAREALQTRYSEIKTNVTNGVDRVVTGTQTRLAEVRTGVDTNVIQPTVAEAHKLVRASKVAVPVGAVLGTAVATAPEWVPFAVANAANIATGGAAIAVGGAAYLGGRAAQEAWKQYGPEVTTRANQAMDAGRQAVETGVDTARGAATVARQGFEFAVGTGKQKVTEAVTNVSGAARQAKQFGQSLGGEINAMGAAAVGAGREAVVSGIESGKQTVRSGVESGRRTVAEAKEKANEWRGRVGSFFRRGGEAIQGEIQLRRAQVDAARHDMVAGVAETRANVVGGIYERGFGFLQKINSSMEGAKASAENHKRMAAEGRANVAGVKGLGLRLTPRGK